MTIVTDVKTLYRLWLDRILNTHVHQTWDQPGTTETEEDDDWFHDRWEELRDDDRKRLCGLSADLHSLRDKENLVAQDSLTKEELASALEAAFTQKQWDKLLELLRHPSRFAARAMVDYLRGRAWMEMGEPGIALLFFDNAARLDPANQAYPSLALECLKAIPDWPRALARAEQYRQAANTPPRLLFRAADVFHLWGLQSAGAKYFPLAVEVVDRGLKRLSQGGAEESLPSLLAGAYATKALSLEHLGQHSEALTTLDEAVAQFPENDTLLTLRGLLRQQLQQPNAREDFAVAIDMGTKQAWPFLELARMELIQGEYESVVQLCRQGLKRTVNDRISAQFFQFLGIAQFELGDTPEAVQSFAASYELNPLSMETQMNQLRLQTVRSAGQATGAWQVPRGNPLLAMNEIRQQQAVAA